MNVLRFFTSFLLSASLATPAAASPVCEQRRNLQLTLPQQQNMIGLFNQLATLDRYRQGTGSNSAKYSEKLNRILAQNKSQLVTDRMKEMAVEYLMIEQLRQAISQTIGINDPAYDKFHHHVRSILFFSDLAPRPLSKAAIKLHERVNAWADSGPMPAAASLQKIAQAEAIHRMIDTVTFNTVHYADEKYSQVQDRLSLYKQVFISGMGLATIGAAMAFSGAMVTGSSALIGNSGLVLAGCSIGAAGAGFSAILEKQYDRYSTAYIESLNKGTSYVCELNQEISGQKEDLLDQTSSAFRSGWNAGCAFTMGGLVAPKVVTWGVVGAVGLAATVEGGIAINNAYLANKSYLIYQSLMAYSKAESAAAENNRLRAEFYLRQAQHLAQQSGSHALAAILTGAVIPAFARGEVVHALRAGHDAISALIGKSSDNAAMAIHMISGFVNASNATTSVTTTASSQVP